jgi:predicted HTH transcriptional regulator
MDKKKLMNLIKKQEGPKLDFKIMIDLDLENSRKELAKDICAIANSKGGRGYLIIGIEDKTRSIIGLDKVKFSEEQIQQLVSSRCEPPVPISLEFIEIGSKKLAVINIYDGEQKPYQMRDNGIFYIRRGSTTDSMRKEEIVSCLQENFNLNVELCPLVRSSEKIMDKELVDRYFKIQGINIDDTNRLELMESASILFLNRDENRYMATIGGALVFSKFNNIFLPHNMIKIISRSNNKDIILKGDLLSMLNAAQRELKSLLPTNYPVEVLYEVIKNAIVFRDYTNYFRGIDIVIDSTSISVTSPGTFTKGRNINADNFKKRNMWIYEKLIALDEMHRFDKAGNGFTRMQKAFRNVGKVKFVNGIEDNSFKVIFPGTKKYI